MRSELRHDEAIDRRSNPSALLDIGNSGFSNRPKCPMILPIRRTSSLLDRLGFRPRQSHPDPSLQNGNSLWGQFAGRRHLQLTSTSNRRDQPTFVWKAWLDNRPTLAALQDQLARIEPQARFLLLRTVTLETARSQNWPNFFLEELHLRGRKGGSIPLGSVRTGDPKKQQITGLRYRENISFRMQFIKR